MLCESACYMLFSYYAIFMLCASMIVVCTLFSTLFNQSHISLIFSITFLLNTYVSSRFSFAINTERTNLHVCRYLMALEQQNGRTELLGFILFLLAY